MFIYVGIYEFFYGESFDVMWGLGIVFVLLIVVFGSFLSSVLLMIVMYFISKDGVLGWIVDNFNRGYLDYFFWLLVGMSIVNFVFYVVCVRWYIIK